MKAREAAGNKKVLLVYVSAVSVGALLVLSFVAYRRPESADKAAERFLLAAMNGDAATLYRYESPRERALDSTTPAKIEQVWTSVIRPAMQGYTPVGRPKLYLEGDGLEGVARQDFVAKDGRKTAMTIETFKTDDGPKATVSLAIHEALFLKFRAEQPVGIAIDPVAFKQFRLAAFGRAYASLLAAQFTEYVSIDPTSPGGYMIIPMESMATVWRPPGTG